MAVQAHPMPLDRRTFLQALTGGVAALLGVGSVRAETVTVTKHATVGATLREFQNDTLRKLYEDPGPRQVVRDKRVPVPYRGIRGDEPIDMDDILRDVWFTHEDD